ncbi:MAG TPA: heparinase II/III family protein [Candidatus Brocadiia bacterium]|nr:heparinase II/III family protein [Candidatus Brocadiia bacterium]
MSADYTKDALKQIVIPKSEWTPFLRDAGAWLKLADEPANRPRRDALIESAEKLRQEGIPVVLATQWMEFTRTGARRPMESPYGKKREMLATFALAEAMKREGKYLDPLIDVVWSICEESGWNYSAHNAGMPLPDTAKPIPDLGAAGTALTLAEVDYFLGEAFPKEAAMVRARIRREVDARVIRPFLESDEHWWQGFKGGEVNNWNAVCNAGVLGAAMYLEDDEDRLAAILEKSLRSIEYFLNCYGPDGGCDEGVGYWHYGVGHLVLYAHFMYSRTNGRINIFEDRRAKAMAEFPHRVHLFDDCYVNFADCSLRASMSQGVLAYYAKMTGSAGLAALASNQPFWTSSPPGFTTAVRDLFWAGNLKPSPLIRNRDEWFPDMQWMVCRFDEKDQASLTVTAKAGHNAEKHNHNDGGNFAICAGEPLIIDMGVGVYTRQTFSSKRYELLATRSIGHNVPLINGREQSPGRKFQASDVSFASDGAKSSLRQDIKGFYPPEAGIVSWIRTVTMDRSVQGGMVVLSDEFIMEKATEDIVIHLYTPHMVDQVENGCVIRGKKKSLTVEFNRKSLLCEIVPVPLEDDRLRSTWGEALSRIRLQIASATGEGSIQIAFRLV